MDILGEREAVTQVANLIKIYKYHEILLFIFLYLIRFIFVQLHS